MCKSSIVEIMEYHRCADYIDNVKDFNLYGRHKGKFNNNLLIALGMKYGVSVDGIESNSYNGYVSVDKISYGLLRVCVSDNNLLLKLDLENIAYKCLKCYERVYVVDIRYYKDVLQIYEMVD